MAGKIQSLKGHLLLDSGQLHGSFFHRSVVLICQHDAEGAFGLVLNKLSESKVGEALVVDLPEHLREQPVFVGGPVQPGALSYLHTDTFLPDASVMPNLSIEHSLEGLMEIGQSFSPSRQVKIFAGYSGWSAGQLEDEFERKAWIVHPASLDLIFQTDPSDLWKEILRTKDWQARLLAEAPEDLSWN